jgi:hypothetical protein
MLNEIDFILWYLPSGGEAIATDKNDLEYKFGSDSNFSCDCNSKTCFMLNRYLICFIIESFPY